MQTINRETSASIARTGSAMTPGNVGRPARASHSRARIATLILTIVTLSVLAQGTNPAAASWRSPQAPFAFCGAHSIQVNTGINAPDHTHSYDLDVWLVEFDGSRWSWGQHWKGPMNARSGNQFTLPLNSGAVQYAVLMHLGWTDAWGNYQTWGWGWVSMGVNPYTGEVDYLC